ncbi:nudix domain-containing protein [Ophiostoma piceae UAMH 11346]|uniref:Nudix domain-containing protein n=1 Tax=Ophiostoma piceae (strain UAMH 11346) TaxID=1262450 RepID=S3BYR2_OPHP1|nr:nudix domain-containing protein [Ophiostoma piceae UAMH 11346]
MPPQNPPPSVFAFTFDPSLQPFNVSPQTWLTTNDKHFAGLAVAAVVFDDKDRVLLVQRAAHDSMPNKWEVPGGAADQDGDTLLGGAARELWEEAGLIATRFTRIVPQPAVAPDEGAVTSPAPAYPDHPGSVFSNRSGSKIMVRFAFQAEVESCAPVVLDPEEHQDYVWATEAEVRAGVTTDGRLIPATVPATRAFILEAFRLRGASN